jgi:hypothetical protein
MDDLYLVRVRSGRGQKSAFRAAVEHVGTRARYHFDSVVEFIAFLESRCAEPEDPPLDPNVAERPTEESR